MINEDYPVLVFGGPYSNLQATVAMRATAERLGLPASNVICTGDVVAYAAEPEETAQLIRAWGIRVVAGNCEEQLGRGAPDCGCGFEEGSLCDSLSRGWYPFALGHTTVEVREWMAALPPRLDFAYAGNACSVIHGGATRNNQFVFASEHAELEAEFLDARRQQACDIVFAGHAGIPFISEIFGGLWVNAGVIGMPANDGTRDGWYALMCSEQGGLGIGLRRLAYDHVAAAAAMRRAGHANGYARTMITGIWPSHDILPRAEREATGQRLSEVTYRLRNPAMA